MVDGNLQHRLDARRDGLRAQQHVAGSVCQRLADPAAVVLALRPLARDHVVDQLRDGLEEVGRTGVHRQDDLGAGDDDVLQLGLVVQLVVLWIPTGQHGVQNRQAHQHGHGDAQPGQRLLAAHALEAAAHQGPHQHVHRVGVGAKERHHLDRSLGVASRAVVQEVDDVGGLEQGPSLVPSLGQHALVHGHALRHVGGIADVIQAFDQGAEHVAVHDAQAALDLGLGRSGGAVEASNARSLEDVHRRVGIGQAGQEALPHASDQGQRVLHASYQSGGWGVFEHLLELEHAGQGDRATGQVGHHRQRRPHLEVQVLHAVDR